MNESSFLSSLKVVGQKPDVFADLFYDLIFKECPDLKGVFRNTDLRLQKAQMIKGLLTISTLLESSKDLTDYLKDLGVRHTCYEVELKHYPLIAKCFLNSLKTVHGESWDEELAIGWKENMNFITAHMIDGAHEVENTGAEK